VRQYASLRVPFALAASAAPRAVTHRLCAIILSEYPVWSKNSNHLKRHEFQGEIAERT
jgi:hypothetical protein